MPIPAGTKFHGVAPGVDTENRGSANANSDRDAYTIEDFSGNNFQAYLFGSTSQKVLYDTVVELAPTLLDNPTDLPMVAVTVYPPNYFYKGYNDSVAPVGFVKAGNTRGSIVDVVVQGHQNTATLFCVEGVTPTVGDNIYPISGGILVCGTATAGDIISCGTVTGNDPVLVTDYGSNGAVWQTQAYYSFPAESPYYVDGISYSSSVRQNVVSSDFAVGDILKISTPTSLTENRVSVSRVEVSDPIESFVGIAADMRQSPGSLPTDVTPSPGTSTYMACMSGNLFLPAWTINGPAPVQGGLIYVDATTPYKITTDSTSGTVVGLVQALDKNSEDVLERVLIQVKL